MKLLNKQIDMISWTSKEGIVTPVRFRMEESGETVVVKVTRVLRIDKTLMGGAPTLCFRCTSVLPGTERIYELTYHSATQQWLLKKA